ncbi:MAG: glycosyltransferase [Nocardioides sp.]
MRVLISSTSGHGHVLPMMSLALALQSAGHDVLWALAEDAQSLVSDAGVATAPAGQTRAESDLMRRAILRDMGEMAPHLRAAYVFPRLFGGDRVPPMVADLLPLARGWRPDLMVHEMGEFASALVGDLLGVPHVSHAFGGGNPPDQVEAAAERLGGLWRARGLEVPPYAGAFSHLHLDICPPAVQTVPLDHIARRQPLRPGTYAGPEPADVRSLVDDGSGRPLVYLTLGTVQNREALFTELLGAVAALDVRVLVTLGPGADPSVLGPQPPGVRVEAYVAQSAVLPFTDVVASHAGSGTVLATLAHGIPQLCLPQAADQFRNAAGVERAGAGLRLLPPQASPSAVAVSIRRLLEDPAYGEGARRVSDEIAAMPAPEEVVGVLEELGLRTTDGGRRGPAGR